MPGGEAVLRGVRKRQEREAQSLAGLTGWDLAQIRSRMELQPAEQQVWWERLWR